MIDYPYTPYQRWLETYEACRSARLWVGDKTPAEAWQTCPRASWMLWQVSKCDPPEELRAALVNLGNGIAAATRSAWATRAARATRAEAARTARAAATAAYAVEDEATEAEMAEMADEVRSALSPVLPKLEN